MAQCIHAMQYIIAVSYHIKLIFNSHVTADRICKKVFFIHMQSVIHNFGFVEAMDLEFAELRALTSTSYLNAIYGPLKS